MPRKRTIAPALIAGPYVPPPFELGSSLVCRLRGRVNVRGVSEAPIAWPWCYASFSPGRHSSRPSLILTDELVRAVRTETVLAIAYWWGVNRRTATGWRKMLGVPRMALGTQVLWTQLAGVRLHGDARSKGGIAVHRKEVK
jgi:hypothetical protein